MAKAINDIFYDESEFGKVQIALLHMSEQLRRDGEVVFSRLKLRPYFTLADFMDDLYKLNFPAPHSSLDLGFRSLTQSYPVKSTIMEYSRRFKTFTSMLKYDVNGLYNKFVDGLASSELKLALRRNQLEGKPFDEIVSMAVSIGNNLTVERAGIRSYVREKEAVKGLYGESALAAEGEEDDEMFKIMGVSIKRYFLEADRKNVNERCFNCFSKAHMATECPHKSCKFCDKPVNSVNHLSLLCPSAPRTLTKFLQSRDKEKAKRATVKIAEDFEDFVFSSDELSD